MEERERVRRDREREVIQEGGRVTSRALYRVNFNKLLKKKLCLVAA